MPSRHSVVPNLDLSPATLQAGNAKAASPLTPGAQSSDGLSPLTPHSPKSSSSSPFFKGATIRPVTQDSNLTSHSPTFPASPGATEPPTPGFAALPPYPPSPRDTSKHTRDASKSFFSSLKAPKYSHKAQRSDSSGNSAEKPKSRGSSRDRRAQISSKLYESSPDLPAAVLQQEADGNPSDDKTSQVQTAELKKVGTETDGYNSVKKAKPRFANLLSRSRSIRMDDSSVNRIANRRPSTNLLKLDENTKPDTQESVRTLPSRQVGNGTTRGNALDRSADGRKGSLVPSASLSQVSGASAAIFNNLKQSSSGAADRLGKAGKGFFGKITRSGSTNERELVADDNYVCSVINLPLIEQARRTRIAKKLEDCRDKTEFWMPALPYRCIDYLNFRGCEEEGLYRVPGSGKEVKHWQRRFDTELDVSLFDEPDLYDINIIGSMFKAWLREIPDELFPKSTQAMIAEKCEGATTAPQLLKDELSKLPPYHYYLLFAITCHLNLLHSYVDQNKMDYRNICICFQPCMKIDAFCFQLLVCDWKNCWQGCWTEKEYLQREKEMDEKEQAAQDKTNQAPSVEERAVSSGSSQSSFHDAPSAPPAPPVPSAPSVLSASSRPETPKSRDMPKSKESTPKNKETTPKNKKKPGKIEISHARNVSQLPELGPPLSPIQI